MFGSLHTRSHYSFLSGASSPDELARQAAALGHHMLCLTDVHGVYGAVRHQRACHQVGLRPLIGCEIIVDGMPLVLIARNMSGYGRIGKMLTMAHQDREHPQLELDVLRMCGQDVAVLTGGHDGRAWQLAAAGKERDLCSWLERLRNVVPGHVHIELVHQQRPRDSAVAAILVRMGHAMDLPCVIGGDVRYATRDAYASYDAAICIREGITIFDHHAARPVNDEQCLRSEALMWQLLPYDEAFAATSALAHCCSFDIIPEHITPPSARLPEGTQPTDVLRSLVETAFVRRYAGDAERCDQARRQVEHELHVISDLGLADFFLVVKEVVDEAQRRSIRHSGRGSAANSIVAYLLGITGVCPLRHHLLFERFLHRGRKGTPDIDVDFDSERREEIIAWMEERFGMEQTAMTATIITYRARMAVRDAAKVLGWPMDTVHAMSKSIPGYTNKPIVEYRENIERITGGAPIVSTLLDIVTKIEGRPRHLGQHSGGMILSHRPLWQLTPIQISANGVHVVQFDKDDVEAMGLVKFDVLGLRMLACIAEAIELIQRREGVDIDIDELPLDDDNVFAMMREGCTLGVFQIESQGQMHLLAQHQPECFDDLVTEVALFRPGPLQGGMVHPYIRRRRGIEPITYMHPDLEPILHDTLGIILFQEQVLEIAHRFAGMSLDDADDFRSLVSKQRDRQAMAAMKDRFIDGAMHRGVDRQSAELVYEKVSHFVGYGFCRSHAAAFAKIVYQSAWLKHYHPACYMAAFMQHRPGFYNLMTLEEEARRCGVPVKMPDIAISGLRYDVEQDADGVLRIQKPLTSIANCSVDVMRSVVWERAHRPFSSVEDVWLRTSLPSDVMESMALSGAMDALAGSSRRALWEVGVIRRRMERYRRDPALFDRPIVMEEDVPMLPPLRAQERLAYDYRTHGAARLHPMTLYRRAMNDLEVRTIETCMRMGALAEDIKDGRRRNDTGVDIIVAGIVILRQSPPTAKGVLFVTLEDETGFVQCVVQPAERQQFAEALRHAALIVKGRLHAVNKWRGLLIRDVRILTNVIGGYYGHPAMYGGTDQMELSVYATSEDTPQGQTVRNSIFVS